jgi:3-phenylpropionate/trans-cinnamate dioxygenase ferredoxin reductase component
LECGKRLFRLLSPDNTGVIDASEDSLLFGTRKSTGTITLLNGLSTVCSSRMSSMALFSGWSDVIRGRENLVNGGFVFICIQLKGASVTIADIQHIVVVGGGQAAGIACQTLRAEGFQGTLSVVANEPHDFYERPPLSKGVLTDTYPKLPRMFSPNRQADLDINWYRPLVAVKLDAEMHELTLSDGQVLHYDRLLLATGSRARVPDELWLNLPGVMTLRSWDDAQKLRQRLARTQRLAIIGGGWIGLELAASARALGVSVDVLERQDRVCERSIGPEVSDELLALHKQHGVRVNLSCRDLELEAAGAEQTRVVAPHVLDAVFETVVVGTGVLFNLELAHQADLQVGQGILVDAFGQTSEPDIYAAGDVAQHPLLGICPQSWSYAQNQSACTAKSMLGVPTTYDESPWLWSDQHGVNIQILGTWHSELHCVVRREAESVVVFYLDVHNRLVHMVAMNQPRAIKLGKRWLQSRRLLNTTELTDPQFKLMNLK